MKELVIQPFIGIYAVSKQQGILPTWAFARQAACHVPQAPIRSCSFVSVPALAAVLSDYLAGGLSEVDMSFDDVRKSKTLEVALGVTSEGGIEKNTVSIDVEVGPNSYELVSLRRAASGRWDSNEPYALKISIPKEKGLEVLAQAIIDHVQSRKDLPDERVIGVSPSIAKGA